MTLQEEYIARHQEALAPCALKLLEFLSEHFSGVARIDRIDTRAKSPDRFIAKAEATANGVRKYADPLADIQDQIGARIVCFFQEDVAEIRDRVLQVFRAVEYVEKKPQGFSSFGYFGWHAILFLPVDVTCDFPREKLPTFFEMQVKTLFQHAWSEAEHDLGYKQFSGGLNEAEERLIAYSAAQAWGADNAFQAVLESLRERKAGKA